MTTFSKPPAMAKLPAMPKPSSLASRIASHILLHTKYPNSLPKLPKSVSNSLPAVMR